MNEEPDKQRVQAALDSLSEHFDAVQIFATRYEMGGEGMTVNVQMGSGNWFARYGHVGEWMIKQDEYTRLHCRKEDDL